MGGAVMGLRRLLMGDPTCPVHPGHTVPAGSVCLECKREKDPSRRRGVRPLPKTPESRAGKPVVHQDARGHQWCECGHLLRNGRCSAITCGVGK